MRLRPYATVWAPNPRRNSFACRVRRHSERSRIQRARRALPSLIPMRTRRCANRPKRACSHLASSVPFAARKCDHEVSCRRIDNQQNIALDDRYSLSLGAPAWLQIIGVWAVPRDVWRRCGSAKLGAIVKSDSLDGSFCWSMRSRLIRRREPKTCRQHDDHDVRSKASGRSRKKFGDAGGKLPFEVRRKRFALVSR